jgi:hypothetical protein
MDNVLYAAQAPGKHRRQCHEERSQKHSGCSFACGHYSYPTPALTVSAEST